MPILKLFISCILLVFGMTVLPPLTGAGAGSFLTRIWLVLGLLTFFGHYQFYITDSEQKKRANRAILPMARRQTARKPERSLGRM